MRYIGSIKLLSTFLLCVFALTACKSSEERAEEYFQSGLELIESGDYDRAIVELRNVFEFDPSHREARFTLATIMLEEKNSPAAAYRQYLRLAEQLPDDLEIRIILAELAFQGNNWDEIERHASKAIELAPDDPQVQALAIALAYRTAALEENLPGLREQGRAARALLSELPDNIVLRRLMVDFHTRNNDNTAALAAVDWLIERTPDNQLYWSQRLGVLAKMNNVEAIEEQLLQMVERFPENIENAQSLMRFYMSRGETDKAESFLRTLVANADEGNMQPRADLVNFLLQTRGLEAAQVELEAAIAETPDPTRFLLIRAGLQYANGEQDKAITALEGILETAEPSDQTQDVKIALAKMLLGVGNDVGARARVEELLAEDAGQPEALKMKAAWDIQSDEADAAINSLRLALDRAPEDAQAMTLMAEAYMRAGSPELAQEFMALAVDASGNAPRETLTYARVLMENERYLPAEDILLPALRLAPRNIDLLGALGALYLRMEDLARAEQVASSLRKLETAEAEQAANRLQADIINQNDGVAGALSYLEGIAQSDDATLNNRIELIRARLVTGDAAGALALAKELQAETPENLAVQAITASVEAAAGNDDAAIEMYRAIVTAEPNATNIWLNLARVIGRRDGTDAGQSVVEEALAVSPEDANLLWASASFKERSGDVDGAIEIYETLYARNSGSIIVANNLASLLSTYRTDADSLQRAWTVARRFRDTDIAAMQDTYGWILHRRGESAEALSYLEAAAQELPNEPLVQYHLGQVYDALERPDDALAQYRLTVQIAGPSDTRPQVEEARSKIEAAEN